MFKNFWYKIKNRGVTENLDFNIKNKIRIFNSSIFVIGSLYLFYTVVGLLRGDYLAAALTFTAWAISASCLYLMTIRKYQAAYHTTAILGIAFLFTFIVGVSSILELFIRANLLKAYMPSPILGSSCLIFS